MRLPSLNVNLRCSGQPLPHGFVNLWIHTFTKQPFGLQFGPADEAGRIAITRDDLLAQADQLRRDLIMDYSHPEDDWTGVIRVRPATAEDLRQALRALDIWYDAASLPRDRQRALQRSIDFLALKPGALLTLDAIAADGQAKIRAEESRT